MSKKKTATFLSQLCLWLLVGCSTLGPQSQEAMLTGMLHLQGYSSPTMEVHHLEFYGQLRSNDQLSETKRLFGVWFDKKSGAFSIPVPWHENSQSVTLKQMDIFFTTPLGEHKTSIAINLELVPQEKKCLDMGGWNVDVSQLRLLNIVAPAQSSLAYRQQLFKHCPAD